MTRLSIMVKVIIIGGGIAGLAAAHLLSSDSRMKIEIYESEPQIGGQASSQQTKTCYTEYSWRIFGQCYHNLMYIINELEIWDNFEPLRNTCFIENSDNHDATLNFQNLMKSVYTHCKWSDLPNYLSLACQCPERLISEYDNVNALDYFQHNPIIKSILGPFLGMEANRVSLSGALKNIISVNSRTKYQFTPNSTLLSKYPTQQSLFVPWAKFLEARGVKIYLNSLLEDLWLNNEHQISGVKINGNVHQADEYILACSLKPLNQIVRKNQRLLNLPTFQKMRQLETGLQLYFTINMYFSEPVSRSDECLEMVMVNEPWQPIIQKKRSWGTGYLKNCQINGHQIGEVWNVGFLDYNEGNKIKKRVGECNLTEAVTEGINQVANSQYFQKLLQESNKTFTDVYLGHEHWYQFLDVNQKLESLNPKFSINVGVMKNMPTNHPEDLPSNLYLSGYYVNSTMGGVSMEASTETGMQSAKLIMDKYNLTQDRGNLGENYIPIKHQVENLTNLTWPLTKIDEYLYRHNKSALTSYISPVILLIIYLLVIIVLLSYLINAIIQALRITKIISHSRRNRV